MFYCKNMVICKSCQVRKGSVQQLASPIILTDIPFFACAGVQGGADSRRDEGVAVHHADEAHLPH